MNRPQILVAALAVVGAGSIARAQTYDLHIKGTNSSERLGFALSGAGDINGDGFEELLVGASLTTAAFSQDGAAAVYSGASGVKLWTTNGNGVNALFGASVAALGDVNGDGRPDFLVGAPFQRNGSNTATGMVGVMSGAYVHNQSGAQFLKQLFGTAVNEEFGAAVARLGDVNGDGKPEIAVGAPGASVPGKPRVGRVDVYSGVAPFGLLWSYSESLPDQAADDRLGDALSSLGDVSGDGVPDLLVGIPSDDLNNTNAGAVHVVSGASGLFVGAVFGTGVNDAFGSAVGGGGDVTGDGIPDFAVGAPFSDVSFVDAGRVTVFDGATRAFLTSFLGSQTQSQFGTSISFAGDVDADGVFDILVGAPFHDFNNLDFGTVKLYSGRTLGVMREYPGGTAFDHAGQAVAIISGIVPDGHADIAFGAPYFNTATLNDCGAVYVASGDWYAPYTYCVSTPNSAGSGAQINWTGSTSLSSNTFTLVTTGCPSNKTGLYFYGPIHAYATFGNGVRCIGNPLYRLPVTMTDAGGVGTTTVDFGNLPPLGPIEPGDSRNFQFWFRDPTAGGAQYDVSNALNASFLP